MNQIDSTVISPGLLYMFYHLPSTLTWDTFLTLSNSTWYYHLHYVSAVYSYVLVNFNF